MKLYELASDDQDRLLATPMNEMANLYPTETGLPVVVWFGEVGGQHGPRIKVSNTPGRFNLQSNFVLSVAKNPDVMTPKSVAMKPSDLENVKDWVKLNYDVLMKLWKIHESGDGNAIEELANLQKI